MTVRLDLKDRKLLYELDIGSRQSASQLAKKVGISKQGCTFKINNLLKKGAIKSMIAILNTPMMGFLSFRMYFKLIDVTPEEQVEFRKHLVAHPDIPWVVGCEGMWDYIIVVFPKDFEDFEKFNMDLNNRYGKFIEKKDVALVTKAHHFRSGYILGKKEDLQPLIYAGQPNVVAKLDQIDLDILHLLSNNSRIPIVDMSKRIGVSSKVISYRIEQLEKKQIIEGYTMTVDYEKIGYERYKIFVRTKNMSEERERTFIQYSRMHPYMLYYSKSIGENDIELEMIVRNGSHMREIIADIRKKFGDLIKSYETLKIYEEYKLNFFPWKKPIN